MTELTTDINLSGPNTPERTPNIPAWPIGNTIANLSLLTSTTNEPITASQANGVTEKLRKKTYCVGTIRIENESKSRRQIDKGNSMLPTNSSDISECKGPPAGRIRHMIGAAPMETVNQQSEDHSWRWHAPYKYYTKGSVFEENWPNLKSGRTRNVNKNKQSCLAKPVDSQTPK